MEMNEVLEKLPQHLLNLVINQPYNSYSSQDHAVWRYVMRRNVDYLKNVAHHSYVDGLRQTGISINSIPHMYGMNRILKEIGWAAVAVDGFIPPAAFMEFQAYNVLVIAADIRPIDQIEYTPAPDIIHEAAGHAPIIADPEYAHYLRYFGEIGSKAFSSSKDYKLYEAIRLLSILKADPYSKREKIMAAEKNLHYLENNMGGSSEMALIRNLHWWTVEYGLVGALDSPKIYGAGLLSSIGESYSSLQPQVKKLPYTIKAKDFGFDITTRQPQLFVTPNFENLTDVLDKFADQMALRKGGADGMKKAIESGNTATIVYNSGLQVSGTFTEMICHDKLPAYIRTTGPTQLAFNNKELPRHSKHYHKEGFGSPVGKLINTTKPLQHFTDTELKKLKEKGGNKTLIRFESGIIVNGILTKVLREENLNILITLTDCLVTYKNQVLFEPGWGNYDMAVGDAIVSAYNGPADPDAFELYYPAPKEKTHKIQHSREALILHDLYASVRSIREKTAGKQEVESSEQKFEICESDITSLKLICRRLKNGYPDDWLLPLEIFEILKATPETELTRQVHDYLLGQAKSHPELYSLTTNGLELIINGK